MSKLQNFTVEIEQVHEISRQAESNCNEIMFVNKGTVTGYVEKYPIVPGDYLSVGGNQNEFCKKVFNVENPAGCLFFIFRKYYI